MKKLLLSCAMLLASAATTMFAVPAMPGLVKTVTQPDGTTLQVRVFGDEHSHCYMTADLVPVIADNTGTFRYATLDADGQPVASGLKAVDASLRTAADNAFVAKLNSEVITNKILARRRTESPRRSAARAATNQSAGIGLNGALFPHEGDVNALIILVEYTDVKFQVNNAGDYFTRMLNEEGFSDHNGRGSARDYFISSSAGKFRPTFDVYGPVSLPNNRAYYGGNHPISNSDINAEQMVVDACKILHEKGQINFADYDTDNDGKVDNIYIIYAGQGEASYGPAESVWPHQWELSAAGINLELGGKVIDHYGCCNEWDEVRPSGIGTFCHEFGHVLGLPDLYTTNYNAEAKFLTPGSYDIMDHGSYNNDSRTPAGYSVFERNAMGWIDLTVLEDANTVVLENMQDSNTGCIIATSRRNEFFLLENRQQTGWDQYIPGHGMLIWHIDYSPSIWSDNVVNNTAAHQYVDLIEAGNRTNNSNTAYMASYPFPGTSRVTSFTDDTTPAMRTWAGDGLNLPITDISEYKGVVTFDVAGGVFEMETPVMAASDITPGGFTLSWNEVQRAFAYTVNVYTKDDDGNRVPVKAYTDREVEGGTLTIDRLDAETRYYATVVAHTHSIFSEPSEEIEITTGAFDFALAVPHTPETQLMDETSFTATWEPVKDAADYLLTVTGTYEVPTTDETCDFGSRNTLKLPEGWDSNTTAAYTATGYYKAAPPALQMNVDGTYFQSAIYDKDIISISFWCRLGGSLGAADNYLEIEGRATENDSWQLIATVKNVPFDKAGLNYSLDEIPAGIRQMRVTYFKISNGNMAIDDCVVSTGGKETMIFGDYDDLAIGNATSHVVSFDAARSTTAKPLSFTYSVKARDNAGKISLQSDPVEVTDPAGAADAITDIIATDGPTAIYTLQGTRVAGTPAPGIYIRRTGTKTEKVIIR